MAQDTLSKIEEMPSFSPRLDEAYTLLSEAQKRELSRYLTSAYFVRDKNLLQLHNFFCSPSSTEARYDKLAAWKFVFIRTPFNEKKFRYLVSDLLSAVESFIYLEQVLEKKPGYYQHLHRYYTLHEATENHTALAAKIQNTTKLAKVVLHPSSYLERHFESELIEELHTSSLKAYRSFVKDKPTGEPGGLDSYYVIEKLRQMCHLANNNNVFGLNNQSFNQAEVLKLAVHPTLQSNFFVAAYYHVYQLLISGKEAHYYNLNELVNKYGFDMDETTLADLLTYARNFCIAQVNAGQSRFFDELLELYRQGLKYGSLLPNGEINERNYKNIVTTALRTGQHEWALDFMEEYRYKLNKVVRDNAYNYNMANYYFHAGKYDKVLRNLQKVQLADLFYGLDARSLMLKCYFELDETEAFMNTYYSFRTFVQRRKNVSKQHQKFYLNLLRLSKKLMNLRPSDRKAIEKLDKEIKTSTALADKNWLEEKLKVYL